MARIDQWLKDERWDLALPWIERLLERGDSFRSSTLPARGDPGLRVGLAHALRSRLALLPEPGRKAYLARYEAQAAQSLERGDTWRDAEALAQAARSFAFCPAGREAAEGLCRLLVEDGRPGEALPWLGFRRRYRAAAREDLLLEAYCLASEGRLAAGQDLARQAGTAPGFLESLRAAAPARRTVDAWDFPRGDEASPDAASFAALKVRGFHGSTLRHDPGEADAGPMGKFQIRRFALDLPFFPVWRDGRLLYHNSVEVYARDGATGKLLWSYTPEGGAETYRRGQAGTPYGLALSADQVFAVLVNADLPSRSPGGEELDLEPYADLYCLDAASGRLLWTTEGREWWGDTRYLSRTSFEGVPLVRGELVFAPLRARGAVFVAAFRRDSGELAWHSFAGGDDSYLDDVWRAPALAEADGVVVCLTQRAALTALESGTGEVLWRFRYNPRGTYYASAGQAGERGTMWIQPPLIAGPAGDRTIVALPADYQQAVALSAHGQKRWERPMTGGGAIAGVVDGAVVLAAAQLAAVDLATGKDRAPPAVLPGIHAGSGMQLGKAFLLPRREGLARARLDGSWTVDPLVPWSAFPAEVTEGMRGGERAGANLILAGDRLLVAGSTGISILQLPEGK